MANDFIGPPSVLRRGVTAAAVLIVVGSGIVAATRSSVNNNTIQYEWQKAQKGGQDSGSGITVAKMTSSGSLTLSGTLLVSDQKTGSGKVSIGGADGARFCKADTDGTGYTLEECNNGVCTNVVAQAGDCP